MPSVLVVVGLGLLVLPGLARPLGRRIDQRRWAHLCTAALGAGLVLVELGLLALGVGALVASDRAGCSLHCGAMMDRLAPGGPVVGSAAILGAVVVAALAIRALLRASRTQMSARVDPLVGRHTSLDPHELVVLPALVPIALAVAGRPGQVLVSEGLLGALEPADVAAVVGHERAHLEHAHHRYLMLAEAVEGGFARLGPVRRSAAALRVALERWADEAAASSLPRGRDQLRSALVRTALLRIEGSEAAPVLAGFSAADTVLERLAALERAPSAPSVGLCGLLYVPGVFFGLVAVAVASGSASQMRLLVSMLGHCHF
ncbi:MAG: M56 family metallopeptidase [Actinomycetota bacterium]|nr:M56 family metallopeptidase [Actinomycetota bacterium]